MNAVNTPVYTDFQSLTSLKAEAGRDADGSLDKVASQFEAMFVQQMLKSMRQASLGEGLFDNDQSLLYRDMYDQQLSLHLSQNGGIGLADVLKRQLGGDTANESAQLPVKNIEDYRRHLIEQSSQSPAASKTQAQATDQVKPAAQPDTRSWSPVDFVEQLLPAATEAASMLGLQPQALLAQAALETGWGRHMMQGKGGEPANNLFGIKADKRWNGDRVSVQTLEYQDGVAAKQKAQFRAYDSLADSFRDYVDFVKSNPRYGRAVESVGDSERYFSELQRAGYATDPNYAKKIKAVMQGPEMTQALERLKAKAGMPL